MRRMALVALVALALALSGCAQVAALTPVGGAHVEEVRFAAIDVLLDQGIALAQAPFCVQEPDQTVLCSGTTADGDTVFVDSAAQDPATVTVTSGLETVYHGSIQDALDRAASAP